jgi:hypothetical protein
MLWSLQILSTFLFGYRHAILSGVIATDKLQVMPAFPPLLGKLCAVSGRLSETLKTHLIYFLPL